MSPHSNRALPLLLLSMLAATLVCTDLGGPPLWEDEADTALFARAIVATGLPTAFDGRTLVDSDDGRRLAPSLFGVPLVMAGTPWLPYYAAAASFATFGESEWAARLPFAVAGLATLVLLHVFVLRTTGSARAAFAAGLVLLSSTQFLLYAREARSYAPNMLLTIAVLYGSTRLERRPRDAWLVVAAIALFHVQILPAVIAVAACGAVALLARSDRGRLRPLLWRGPIVALATLPWLAVTWSATSANAAPIGSAAELPARFAQLALESLVAVPWLGWVAGLAFARRSLRDGDRALLRLCFAWLAACALLTPLALSHSLLAVVGLRYVCGMLPVAAAVTGVLIARASEGRAVRFAALLALVCATHLLGSALPWLALGHTHERDGVAIRVPREARDKVWNTTWWAFVRGLGEREPGTVHAIHELLDRDAGPDDVVVTNFGPDALYWYANRPLGMRIGPEVAAVREVARAQGLPRHVDDLAGTRWLVWRGGNERELGYPLTLHGFGLRHWLGRLEARGARTELVAEIPERLWDNRPELAWHRFHGIGLPFAPPAQGSAGPRFRDARVYRVDGIDAERGVTGR